MYLETHYRVPSIFHDKIDAFLPFPHLSISPLTNSGPTHRKQYRFKEQQKKR